jgi:hypothetical protein
MKWELHGKINYPMHFGLIVWPIRHLWYVTVLVGVQKDLPSTYGVRIQSSLGYQVMEHGL